jgi:hypothetical protein
MIRLRLWSALLIPLLLTPGVRAQEKPASSWAIDRTLQISPQAAPVPALKYRLLPLSSELKEGNAVPIYLRLVHEQADAARKAWSETPKPWNQLPVDQVPLDEARNFLQGHRNFLRQIELGARRRTAEWNYTVDDEDPIGMLLPDAQNLRNYTPMLVLQVRIALAEGDFGKAAHHLETGISFCRHVAEGPTLINRLVGISLAGQFLDTVADFIERPGAPNLYWALTALPRPLIDLRGSLEWEYRMLELVFPDLGDLDRERTAEQWDAVLARVRTWVRNMSMTGRPLKLPDWFPAYVDPEQPAAKSPEFPEARRFVARARGLSAERVKAMAPARVLLLYLVDKYHEARDELYRASYLPYAEARPLLEDANKRRRQAPASEAQLLPHVFLAAVGRIMTSQNRIDRTVAALRTIEALRMYAAAHAGRLPDKLDEVTEAPVPSDPGTNRPFVYRRDGDTATLVSEVSWNPPPQSNLRYRVTIRKN